jgi:phospholipid/cholesterol/gamma-HCH transport system ATP-binding protein
MDRPASAASPQPAAAANPIVVRFEDVSFAFDDHVVLEHVSFTVPKGSMTILFGPSGSGKSVILKLTLGLLRPDSGRIFVNDQQVDAMSERELLAMRADIGMMFQENALFDSLTVAENVGYRLYEETDTPLADVRRRVEEVLGFIGLSDHIDKLPSELSGGQRRRVALARAMATRPALLLLDDPTTGLDPLTSISVNDEIVKLRDLQDVTSILVTHQIRDAFYVATHAARRAATPAATRPSPAGEIEIVKTEETSADARFLVLCDTRIIFAGSAAELLSSEDAYLKEFLFMALPPW